MSFQRIYKDKSFDSVKTSGLLTTTGGLVGPPSSELTVTDSFAEPALDLSSSGKTIGIRLTGTSGIHLSLPSNAPDGYSVKFVVIEDGGSGFAQFNPVSVKSVSSLTRGGTTTNISGTSLQLLFNSTNAVTGDYLEYTRVGNCYVINGVSENATGIVPD